MIEKRLVQWYAADAGVDLDIAGRTDLEKRNTLREHFLLRHIVRRPDVTSSVGRQMWYNVVTCSPQ